MTFRVVNWTKYQGDTKTMKNGREWNPPWFKLYHKLLDDYDFSMLSETSRFHFLGILMLAARTDNVIRADQAYLKHQLRTQKPIDLNIFRKFGWIEFDDIPKNSGIIPEKSGVEERREEEIREEEIKPFSAEAQETAPSTPFVPQLPLEIFDCIQGEKFEVYYPAVKKWQDTFPGIDVRMTLKRIKAWVDANPTKRKTKRGMPSFIVKWLSKEQDRTGTRGALSSDKPPSVQAVGKTLIERLTNGPGTGFGSCDKTRTALPVLVDESTG